MLETFTKIIFTLLHLLADGRLATAARDQAKNYLTETQAVQQALAAKLAETPHIKAELLMGLAFIESRNQPLATSRMEAGQRKTGIPLWTAKPDNVSGPYFCGVTQAEAGMAWDDCLKLRDIFFAYKKAAKELTTWLNYGRGDLEKALGGYGCGVFGAQHPDLCGVKKPGDVPYPARVIYRMRLLQKAIDKPAS